MQVDIRDLSRGPQTVEHQRTFPQTGSVLDTGALLRIADALEESNKTSKSIDDSLTVVVWLGTGLVISFILFLYVYAGHR